MEVRNDHSHALQKDVNGQIQKRKSLDHRGKQDPVKAVELVNKEEHSEDTAHNHRETLPRVIRGKQPSKHCRDRVDHRARFGNNDGHEEAECQKNTHGDVALHARRQGVLGGKHGLELDDPANQVSHASWGVNQQAVGVQVSQAAHA